jgi:hypothetical protein
VIATPVREGVGVNRTAREGRIFMSGTTTQASLAHLLDLDGASEDAVAEALQARLSFSFKQDPPKCTGKCFGNNSEIAGGGSYGN